jgi:hypothetical protein
MTAAPLVGALLLAGCGGDTADPLHDRQASQGVTVGGPNGGAPVVSEFIKVAQEESCADVRNRLYLIDGKHVFWDRAGTCADNSYAQRLFGASPEAVLCQVHDSIAGPRSFCSDEKSRAMFETIQKNLDKADLGLGAGHKVEPISFLPKAGAAIAFESVAKDRASGIVTPRQVVIKDQAAWQALWAEHGKSRIPAPPLPAVDFSRQMLVGVFAGHKPDGCHSAGIVRVASNDGKLVVEYEESGRGPGVFCAAVLTQPMHIVAVERLDAPVQFVQVKGGAMAFTTIAQTSRSLIGSARTVTVRDQDAWARLWAEHAGPGAEPPRVDFSSKMVVGVFMGSQENGCYSTNISQVRNDGNKINVLHVNSVPGKGVMCTLAITTPAHLVAIDRSDSPVVFAKEIRTEE